MARAQRIYLTALNGETPVTGVFAYSYGGRAAAQLCWAPAEYGLWVAYVVLLYLVHRFRFRVLNWRNLAPRGWTCICRPPLVFSVNVERICYFEQRDGEPSGDSILCKNANFVIECPLLVPGMIHAAMGDLRGFHAVANNIAKRLIAA